MKNLYRNTKTIFEKLTLVITAIIGSSFTFILALGIIIFFLSNRAFHMHDVQEFIRDVIHAVTFLSLFVIQKEFNRFSAALHLKVNELVASHKQADNSVLNIEEKTEHEITELAKEYKERAENASHKNIRVKNFTSLY
jgi:low affinity Fe/Cu permease